MHLHRLSIAAKKIFTLFDLTDVQPELQVFIRQTTRSSVHPNCEQLEYNVAILMILSRVFLISSMHVDNVLTNIRHSKPLLWHYPK